MQQVLCSASRRGRFSYNPARRLPRARDMAKPRIDLIDRLQYLALRLVAMSAHCWPVEVPLEVAKLIGTILFRVDRRHRQRAMSNLRRSFPGMPERRIARLAHE